MNEDGRDDVLQEAVYYRLFLDAENARWRMADIPWHKIERERVNARASCHRPRSGVLRADDVRGDAAFSRCVSRRRRSYAVDVGLVLRGDQTPAGALTVAARIRGNRRSFIPATRAANGAVYEVSGGHARHEHHLSGKWWPRAVMPTFRGWRPNRCSGPSRAILRPMKPGTRAPSTPTRSGISSTRRRIPKPNGFVALKVLYLWTASFGAVQHPVNQFITRVTQDRELANELPFDFADVRGRACRVIGLLTGTDITRPADLMPMIRQRQTLANR